jgi:hypothetical protein
LNSGGELLVARSRDAALVVQRLEHALDGLGGLVHGILKVLRCSKTSLS